MEKFQVDLRGIVQILSRHLYSSPRVFVRELLQNAVDAITARRAIEPAWPGHVTITTLGDGTLVFEDDGIGLTAGEIRELLATIGRSSKRDEFEMQREGFLGQFGIGLLSCFLVSDTIEVVTRSARSGDQQTWRWLASGDGTYQLVEASVPLAQPGTRVVLRPRQGDYLLRASNVLQLAQHYGELLPLQITFSDNGLLTQIAPRRAPWEVPPLEAQAYCHATFGFYPMAQIPLHIPLVGVRGVAFVLPTASNPSEPSKHRVYLRRMLLGESVSGLMPDWASFVRVVVDVENLSPTASRESLHEDENLRLVRRELGVQLRQWMQATDASQPQLLRGFIETHHLAVAAAALRDDDVLAIVRAWMPWETTTGIFTMDEMLRTDKTLLFAATSAAYRGLQPIAGAQGTRVLNASYTYADDLLRRFATTEPDIALHGITVGDLVTDDPQYAPQMQRVLAVGSQVLAPHYCEVSARTFDPESTPALYVRDPDRAAQARADNRRAAAEADPLFAGLLGHTSSPQDFGRPDALDTLVLNSQNPVIKQLVELDEELCGIVIRHLYISAVHASGAQLSNGDRQLLTDSLVALVRRAQRR